jgi:hypothetical protein
LHHLNTLIDTIWRLVTSNGQYVNVGIQDTNNYCEHIPEGVINVNGTTIMWNIPVVTGQTMLAHQPAIVKKKNKVVPLQASSGLEGG